MPFDIGETAIPWGYDEVKFLWPGVRFYVKAMP
jgi:hypothetical protein